MNRRWLRILRAGLVTLILFEVVLQVLSFAVHRSLRDPTVEDSSKNTILFVGDSYTFGMGSSNPETHSYPSQVGDLLTAAGDSATQNWQVVNVGRPGHNSAQMTEEFAGHLERHQPQIVVLLGAINDMWSQPEVAEVARSPDQDTPGGWRFECRTWRLLKTLRGIALFRGEARASDPAVVTRETQPSLPDPMAQAWQYTSAREFQQAIDLVEPMHPEHPHQRYERASVLVYAHVALGETERADAVRKEVEAEYEQAPSEFLAGQVMKLASFLSDQETLLTRGAPFRETYPQSYLVALHHAEALAKINEEEAARAEYLRAEPLLHAGSFDPIPYWLGRAGAFGRSQTLAPDPLEAARCLIQARLAGHPRQASTQQFQNHQDLTDEQFTQALNSIEMDDAARAELHEIRAEANSESARGAAFEVTRANFDTMIEHARGQNVEVVLVSYPFLIDEIVAVMDSLHVDHGSAVRHINLEQRFTEELRTRRNDELFVGDGHCNDAGYRVVAEEVFRRGLLPLLQAAQ